MTNQTERLWSLIWSFNEIAFYFLSSCKLSKMVENFKKFFGTFQKFFRNFLKVFSKLFSRIHPLEFLKVSKTIDCHFFGWKLFKTLWHIGSVELWQERCVPWCVLLSEIGGNRLHKSTLKDTPTLIKANTCNKTGDLDIFQFLLSRRKPMTCRLR